MSVLIESDWNLKTFKAAPAIFLLHSINRIRLEFKEICKSNKDIHGKGINRIRLEFKVFFNNVVYDCVIVLIESDWNLKYTRWFGQEILDHVLIESDWNLKLDEKGHPIPERKY